MTLSILHDPLLKGTQIGISKFGKFGFGAYAKSALQAGKPILSVPLDRWYPISAGNAYKTMNESHPRLCEDLIQHVMRQDLQMAAKPILVGSVLLMLDVIHLRQTASGLIKDHLDAMPQDVDLPIFWNDKEVEYLRGTSVFSKISHQRSQILDLYQSVVVPHMPQISAPTFAKTWALLLSRAIANTKDQMPFSVVPVLDFFNHSPDNDTQGFCHHWFNHQTKEFIILPTNDVAEGSQLFISYGSHSNAELLRLYGFCVEDNPFDTVSISMGSGIVLECTRDGVQTSQQSSDITPKHMCFALERKLSEYAEEPVDTAGTNDERMRQAATLIKSDKAILQSCINQLKQSMSS